MTATREACVNGDGGNGVGAASGRPHGLRTTTSVAGGMNWLKVEGDIRAIDIPSLVAAANQAFLRHPVRLVIDLTGVGACEAPGVRWLQDIEERIARRGGELLIGVVLGGPVHRLFQREGIRTVDESRLSQIRGGGAGGPDNRT